jgi:hypothetical protein
MSQSKRELEPMAVEVMDNGQVQGSDLPLLSDYDFLRNRL